LSHVVDLDQGTGASGMVGKMSEMSWIQRAREYLDDPQASSQHEMPKSHPSIAGTASSYFMDDTDLLAVDEDTVDHLQWPPMYLALVLSEAFFHAMQGAFQFVVREQFLDTLAQFPRTKAIPSWAERRWLSLANLVWAIGAKWLQMTQLDNDMFRDNHLVFYARARALGLDHRVLFDHPEVERVQAIGLLAFYLLINGSVTR